MRENFSCQRRFQSSQAGSFLGAGRGPWIQNVSSNYKEYQAAICNRENNPWECYLAFCSLDWLAQEVEKEEEHWDFVLSLSRYGCYSGPFLSYIAPAVVSLFLCFPRLRLLAQALAKRRSDFAIAHTYDKRRLIDQQKGAIVETIAGRQANFSSPAKQWCTHKFALEKILYMLYILANVWNCVWIYLLVFFANISF